MTERANAFDEQGPATFERMEIAGKRVYIVDDHHNALAAWAEERRRLDAAPNLITIDHHTDVMDAFLGHASLQAQEDPAAIDDPEAAARSIRDALAAQMDWRSDGSIVEAIHRLRHDEHIDAATISGTLDSAFCIQLSDGEGTPSLERLAFKDQMADEFHKGRPGGTPPSGPMTYAPSSNRIYVVPFACAIGCEKRPYDYECEIHHALEIIEARYLDDQLARGADMAKCLGLSGIESAPYILDIDLDAFHSSRAAKPEDATTFHRLIRNSIAITIAKEHECVEELWHDKGLVLNADQLLEIVLAHIEAALREPPSALESESD